MATPIRDDAFERAKIALAQASRLNPLRAAQALTAPDSLTPDERKHIVDRLLGEHTQPFTRQLLDAAFNPLVLGGLVLSMRYPILTTERLAVFQNQLKKLPSMIPGLGWAYDIWETFKGTPIPQLLNEAVYGTHVFTSALTKRVGDAIKLFQKESGREWSDALGNKMFLHLDGLAKPDHSVWKELRSNFPQLGESLRSGGLSTEALRLDAHESRLLKRLRKSLDYTWQEVMSGAENTDPSTIKRLLKNLKIENLDEVEYRRDFAPHILLRHTLDNLNVLDKGLYGSAKAPLQEATDLFGLPLRRTQQAIGRVSGVTSSSLRERTGFALPDARELLRAGLIKPEIGQALGQFVKETGRPTYTTHLFDSLEKYFFGLAKTKVWLLPWVKSPELPPLGERILTQYKGLLQRGDKLKAKMLETKWLPLATGQMTPMQDLMSSAFESRKLAAAAYLEKLDIGGDIKERMLDYLYRSNRLTYRGLGTQISNYLHASTLGGNLTASAKNLMQMFTTGYPIVGAKYMSKGLETVFSRLDELGEALKGKPINRDTFESAFDRVYWEFSSNSTDLKATITDHLDQLARTGAIKLGRTWGNTAASVRDTLLIPFTASERVNRLTVFYGQYLKGLKELEGKKVFDPVLEIERKLTKGSGQLEIAAQQAAHYVTQTTQYGGGFMGQPYLIADWWAPLRQFAGFPINFVRNLLVTGTQGATAEGALDLGILGRSLFASGLLYEAGRNVLGTDLSQGLIFGSMPDLRDAGPFAPYPFVSPTLQLVGSAGLGLAKGNTEDLRKALPLLVPGGIALSRASTALSPSVAQALMKPYADYERPLPDGRIPLYTAKGSLLGYYSRIQLLAKAAGWGDVNGQQESVIAKYLTAQSDQIKGYRREIMDAMLNNDYQRVRSLKDEFAQRYPGLQTMLLRQSDLKMLQLRRDIPRLERLISQMPPGQREQMAQAVAVTLGSAAEQFLGSDPALWGQGSPTTRPRAAQQRQRPNTRKVPQWGNSGFSSQTMQQLGEQRADSLSLQGLRSY